LPSKLRVAIDALAIGIPKILATANERIPEK
jgi:hypothetical protein